MSFMTFISRPENKTYIIAGVVIFSTFLVVLIAVLATTSGSSTFVLDETPLIDGRNNLPYDFYQFLQNNITKYNFLKNLTISDVWGFNNSLCPTDFPRLIKGKVGAQFWVADVNCISQYKDAVSIALEQIDAIHRFIKMYPKQLQLITKADEIMEVYEVNKIGSLIAVGNGIAIDSRLSHLRLFYELGVRYMTLTSNCDTPWVSASKSFGTDLGLTPFGEKVVHEMNRLGLIIDLSGSSDRTIRKIMQISKAPVIFSHSAAYSLHADIFNIPDIILQLLQINKGIIMVTFNSHIISNKLINVTIDDVIEHINHIVNVTGFDHVGIGSGFGGPLFSPPHGLDDVSTYPVLFERLKQTDAKRWNQENLKKLAGLNLIRVFKAVEEVRDSLSSDDPTEDWIDEEELNKTTANIWSCRTKMT